MENSNISKIYGNGTGDQYREYNDYEDYETYDYFAEGDYIPDFYIVQTKWETVFRGYITVLLAFLVIISNSFLVLVFARRTTRSQATFILGALAISDAVICLTRLPEAVYFNILGNYEDYIPYRWCLTNYGLIIIYQIFSVFSNWITALLGFQLCLCVCKPLALKLMWTIRNTNVALSGIFLASTLLYIYKMIAIDISELKIYSSSELNVSLPSGCLHRFSTSLADIVGDKDRSLKLFFMLSGIVGRVLPVVILCTTTCVLVYHRRKRSRFFNSRDSRRINNQNAQGKVISRISFIIIVVFLITEIQDGINFLLAAYELSTNIEVEFLSEADIKWDTVSYTLSLFGYACNFWIFFFMSRRFRVVLIEVLRELFSIFRK